ncbi:MAG: nucleotidyltransferase domain-containing protein [Actinobacteria bacterium]|nr:nucleotidyltransferase domain-containing protein [Actinomycetota bacterium]
MLPIRYPALVDYRKPVEALIPGAQGRILGVLARAGAPLNLRTLARLAGISPGQASRVLPRLVELGVVQRTEVPPSALFELPKQNFAAELVRDLVDAHGALLQEMRRTAAKLRPAPASMVLFGSAATGDAGAGSDIDVLVVRPADAADDAWTTAVMRWVAHIREFSGNPVNVLEEEERDIPRLLRSRRSLWDSIRSQGVLLAGKPLDELAQKSA